MKRPWLKWPDIVPPAEDAPRTPLWSRLAWMAMLWGSSVLLLLGIATILRLVLRT